MILGRRYISPKFLIAFLSVIILSLCGSLVFQYTYKQNEFVQPQLNDIGLNVDANSLKKLEVKKDIGFPIRIKIPELQLDAQIEKVGLTVDGDMDVPTTPFMTGWYKAGPKPGESGSAVIDGHVNGENGNAGVFADLYKLKPGAKIIVMDDKDQEIIFIVRESKRYGQEDNASDVFISNDQISHLNLITCEWDENSGDFSQRLVVFSDME